MLDDMLPLLVVGIASIVVIYVTMRLFAFREKQLQAETTLAAEKAAQYAASNAQLEQRVRVLEQIATDPGAETASQIEALRERPALKSGDKAQ